VRIVSDPALILCSGREVKAASEVGRGGEDLEERSDVE
jgi:hypothetical protein